MCSCNTILKRKETSCFIIPSKTFKRFGASFELTPYLFLASLDHNIITTDTKTGYQYLSDMQHNKVEFNPQKLRKKRIRDLLRTSPSGIKVVTMKAKLE